MQPATLPLFQEGPNSRGKGFCGRFITRLKTFCVAHTFSFTHIEQVKRIVVLQLVVIPRYKFRSPSLAYIVLLYKSNSVDIVLNWKL